MTWGFEDDENCPLSVYLISKEDVEQLVDLSILQTEKQNRMCQLLWNKFVKCGLQVSFYGHLVVTEVVCRGHYQGMSGRISSNCSMTENVWKVLGEGQKSAQSVYRFPVDIWQYPMKNLFSALREFQIPGNLIRMTRVCMDRLRTAMRSFGSHKLGKWTCSHSTWKLDKERVMNSLTCWLILSHRKLSGKLK